MHSSPCYVIAEAGVNHNGSEDLALRLIDCAAAAGADGVKFQTFKAEKLVRQGARKAAYQQRQTGVGDQFSMLQSLELSTEAYCRLAEYCHQVGIEFLSTAFDEESFDFLIGLGLKRIKIPSGELTNLPFLRYMSRHDLPLILSTGMADMAEIEEAVTAFEKTRQVRGFAAPLSERLTILHCTSNYPAAFQDVHLRAMLSIKERFGLPVGYSDHTFGTVVAPLAVAMGATVIEKHFTLDKKLPGPDHQASLEPEELNQLIDSIRQAEQILGSPEKKPAQSELDVREVVRRSVTLSRDVVAGTPFQEDDFVLMRPGDGIAPKHLESLYGKKPCRNMKAGEVLRWEDVRV